jgi:hypothetical protein
VDAAEIVKREPARDRCPVILPLLTEGIRKPGEAARSHPRTKGRSGPLGEGETGLDARAGNGKGPETTTSCGAFEP